MANARAPTPVANTRLLCASVVCQALPYDSGALLRRRTLSIQPVDGRSTAPGMFAWRLHKLGQPPSPAGFAQQRLGTRKVNDVNAIYCVWITSSII